MTDHNPSSRKPDRTPFWLMSFFAVIGAVGLIVVSGSC